MIVVIGVGNPLRGDDGVGLVAAEVVARELSAIASPPRLILAHQLTPELAVDLSDDRVDAVVFIDAAVGVVRPELLELPFPENPAPETSPGGPDASSPRGVSHQMGAQTVLAYTRLLRTARLRAWVMRLPVFDLAHGEGLSEPAQTALEALPALCRDLVRRMR